MTVAEVVDLYLADLARVAQPRSVDKYAEFLEKFVAHTGTKTPIDAVSYESCVLFLNKWSGVSLKTGKPYAAATRAQYTSILNKYFEFAYDHDYLKKAMKKFVRPRLPKPEDRNVVVVSTGEVQRMFQACESWGDQICLGILAYTGARRNAVSMLRWRDVDLTPDPPHRPYGWLRMEEKGGKFVGKPIPFLLRQILDRAPEHEPDDYLVPNLRPSQVLRKERKNDIIYKRIKRLAQRAGVEAHVHAIRAAFAVLFLESNAGNTKNLQDLLGHQSIETTRHYLRGIDKKKSMAAVLNLDWGALSDTGALPVSTDITGSGRLGGGRDLPPVSESALSEGDRVSRRFTTGVEGSSHSLASPSESALTEEELFLPVLAVAPSVTGPAEVSPAKREEIPPSVEGEGGKGQSRSSSVSARQETGHEPRAARALLPCKLEKAHTGFEPVSPLLCSAHAPSSVTRRALGHQTGQFSSLGV